MTDINTLPPFSLHSRKMDDNPQGRSPVKKRYEYKEHSSYLSFQLNDVLVIQNIFAFVCRSRQSTGE